MVLLERVEGVAKVVLNDPGHRNALGLQMVDDIERIFDEIERDTNLHSVVVTGAGRAFCSGADVDILLGGDINTFRRVYDAFLRVRRCPLPTIAAVNGTAAGAGLNIVLACDVCVTVPQAKLISRFLEIGLHPGGGHTWLLERAIGPAWTKAMLLFNQEMDGVIAAQTGLALRCVEPEQLISESMALARQAVRIPRPLLVRTKQTFEAMAGVASHKEALALEADAQAWSTTQQWFGERLEALKRRLAEARKH